MTMMLGLDGVEDGHARPMTAQLEPTGNAIWFFAAIDNSLVQNSDERAGGNRAIATFASKGHDLFATVHGSLHVDNDRAVIDRLWNCYVAVWYPGGKTDPKLVLLRLDPERAEIWLDEFEHLHRNPASARLRPEAGLQGEGRDRPSRASAGLGPHGDPNRFRRPTLWLCLRWWRTTWLCWVRCAVDAGCH